VFAGLPRADAAVPTAAAGAAGQAYRAVLRCVWQHSRLPTLCTAPTVSHVKMLPLAGKSQAGALVAVLLHHVYLAALAQLSNTFSGPCRHGALCCSFCCAQAG
jgi:hypothetical protein